MLEEWLCCIKATGSREDASTLANKKATDLAAAAQQAARDVAMVTPFSNEAGRPRKQRTEWSSRHPEASRIGVRVTQPEGGVIVAYDASEALFTVLLDSGGARHLAPVDLGLQPLPPMHAPPAPLLAAARRVVYSSVAMTFRLKFKEWRTTLLASQALVDVSGGHEVNVEGLYLSSSAARYRMLFNSDAPLPASGVAIEPPTLSGGAGGDVGKPQVWFITAGSPRRVVFRTTRPSSTPWNNEWRHAVSGSIAQSKASVVEVRPLLSVQFDDRSPGRQGRAKLGQLIIGCTTDREAPRAMTWWFTECGE
tara:strand:- start:2 stop:925 length:924 start_codon:yes stop_codon:yes gene_type:complete